MSPAVRVWKTDEPCPACGMPLTLTDPGTGPLRFDCPFCDWTAPAPGLRGGGADA
jgi:hypothetical protein